MSLRMPVGQRMPSQPSESGRESGRQVLLSGLCILLMSGWQDGDKIGRM